MEKKGVFDNNFAFILENNLFFYYNLHRNALS